MDERQGTESSWIPKTPMKLTRASICKEKQTNSPSIPHWLIAGRNSETSQPETGNCSHLGNSICFQKEIQAQNAGDSCNQKDSVHESFDYRGVAVASNPSGIHGDSSFYLDLWNRGMAHLINDAAAAAQTAVHADKSSFTPASIYHVKGASSPAESAYSSSTFKGLFQESGCQSEFETYQTKDAELNGCILNHRAPSTPNITNTADKAKGSDEQNYRVGVVVKENEDHALNKIPIELNELQKEGQPELDVDISCSNVSNTLVENHEPDMGSIQNIEVKTPQQRPRKKKHRPKVVIEGKPKRKPRNTTPASSEKVNTPKRKYVRKINASTEAETPTESRIQGDPGSEAKTTLKRKYTRRKEVNEPTVTPPEEEGISGTSSPKNDQTAQRSCRRSLKFDFDSQIPGEKSSCHHISDLGCQSTSKISLTKDQMTSALKPEGRIDINVERTETCHAQYHLQSMGKEFEDYLLSKGVKTVGYSPPTEVDRLNNKSMAGSTNEYSRGRCQIVFSDATHDKVASILESRTQKERGATKPLYTSNYSSSILTQETYGRGKKREQPSSAGLFDFYSIYSAAPQGNYFQDFTEVSRSKEHRQEISFQHFPETFKKKRTNLARTSTNSTMMPAVASTDHHIQNYATSVVNNCREACGFGMMQVNNSADSGPSRISKVHSAQLKQTPFGWFHPLRNAEQITMEESNGLPHSYLLSCFTPTRMLKSMPSVDDIVEQLNRLNVSAESNTLASVEKNALFAYPYEYSGKNALVVYRSDQTMIPFNASSNRKKQRGPRPKVNLDEETARVWTLLLENIDSEGIDGTDEEKRKYWEKERKIFTGRVNSFIAKMRLVQGDRTFRPWKGSVVDSVVGVFLTQNVSDHLSSSAFMSMAARFPLKPSSDRASSSEGISEIHDLLHLDEDTSGEVFGEALKSDENYQELVRNYQKLVGNFTEVTESTGTLKSPSSDSSECGPSASNGETVMSDGDLRASGDILCSQTSVVSPQNSTDSIRDNKKHMFLEEESTSVCFQNTSSFVELLQMQEQRVHIPENRSGLPLVETRTNSEMTESHLEREADHRDFAESLDIKLSGSFKESECIATDQSGLSEESGAGPSSQNSTGICFERRMCIENHESAVYSRLAGDQQTEFISTVQKHAASFSESTLDATNLERGPVKLDASNCKNSLETTSGVSTVKPKPKSGKVVKEAEPEVDWDSYRKQAEAKGKKERTSNTMDSVDWETVRCTEVRDIAETIKERGMNNRLAERIKDFLNRLIRDHESLDLEWLRDIPPDKAKEYLLSVKGLGLKSVECVRLLTLHHLAFPVDTNVGRIAVRLGWVPLQPLPESLQLHLLELYPVLESIQKHLWPRLCKLDQRKLYELHYHMITFGKVFCTKSKPNCNSCPMRGECRHFASAYASARLALPAPQDKSIVTAPAPQQRTTHGSQAEKVDLLQLPRPESTGNLGAASVLPFSQPTCQVSETPKPIIEEPTTPESEPVIEEPPMSESETDPVTETVTEPQWTQCPADIEDYIDNDDEIPTIDLNLEVLNQNLQSIMQNIGLQDSEYSKALMVLTPEAASIPMPKLKNINRLRTEHRVYLLPDSHQLLKGLEKREENDLCPYLLAIWAPGETINSVQPPERKCSSEGSGQLCYDNTCYSCNSIREATSHTVRGTILIPCRTAMRGSFPLNGTYFQVNEVFADHETSLKPIDVPRDWLWNLRRRTVYFGTSIPTIFKGLEPYEIQYCFWKGFVCVRGFDRATRGPRPLIARLHFPASRMPKYNNKGGAGGSGLAKDASDKTPTTGKVAAV